MGLAHHGMVLAPQVGGQLGAVLQALMRGIGQVDFGEGPRANLPGREQVAIVPAFVHLFREVLLVQLSPGTALHGGQGATGGSRVAQLTAGLWVGGEGAGLRPDLC